MHRTLFSLATLALLAAPFVHAQSAAANSDANPSPHRTIIHLNATWNGCPVGFSAGHSNSLTALRAGDDKPGVVSQSLNVRMDNRSARDIVSAQITVHGLSPHGRLTPADAGAAATGDLSKQVALKLPVDAGQHADKDLRVYGFSSVQRIDLDSLTYADGSTWTASSERRCTVIPNGMMLVAAAAR